SLATNTVAPQVASGAVQQIKPVTVQQGVAAPAAQIYCSQCGAQNPHEGKFCKECGAALHKME
ncbi:MAG: zinc ribbon domain-containing protein, partial [Coriobacteriia bacterium]|nr:zinc ribbon domain-containing protein [Coriobacteriia bacterium]